MIYRNEQKNFKGVTGMQSLLFTGATGFFGTNLLNSPGSMTSFMGSPESAKDERNLNF